MINGRSRARELASMHRHASASASSGRARSRERFRAGAASLLGRSALPARRRAGSRAPDPAGRSARVAVARAMSLPSVCALCAVQDAFTSGAAMSAWRIS